MKEEEFDALMQGRSFGTKDAMRAETQLRRIFTLGAEVWGKTPDDLKRQLSAPHPEIRPGIELSDLQELLRRVETILAAFHDPKNAWLAPSVVALLHRPLLWALNNSLHGRPAAKLSAAPFGIWKRAESLSQPALRKTPFVARNSDFG
ncbi:MAG TPA: hypothetical protein VHA06_21630 [Candidatus Angelobacter sp.]|nr:hypothetical protein [Candidatus Angelobacter sp.]